MNRPLLLLTVCLAASASALPPLTLHSSVDGGPATPGWKYLRLGQQVALIARLAPTAKAASVRWFRIDPLDHSLDNTRPQFHFQPLTYRRTELHECRDSLTCAGTVALASLSASPVPGTGTAAFTVQVTLPDGTLLRTPDESSPVLGGLGPTVHRLTVRRDDSYLGHLTELFGTPYIFGSSGQGKSHQTDLLIGSDCADLAVYGLRRLGLKTPYVSTWTIDRHAREVAVAQTSVEGAARNKANRPLSIGPQGIAPGDLLLFPRTRHVGVLYEDRPPLGVLDDGDLLLHTCWARPTVEPLSATGCASYPIRILRPALPGA